MARTIVLDSKTFTPEQIRILAKRYQAQGFTVRVS